MCKIRDGRGEGIYRNRSHMMASKHRDRARHYQSLTLAKTMEVDKDVMGINCTVRLGSAEMLTVYKSY